jgi:O-antigen/teichoic acid export membrane protein
VCYSEIAGHSWPLLINAITIFLISQSDLWILGAYCTDSDVAVYGAAARLVLFCGLGLAIVNKVVPPLIAKYDLREENTKTESILRTTASIATVPAFFVLAVFVIFGEHILVIVFGDDYRGGVFVLTILSAAQVVNVFVGSCGYALIMRGHRKTLMIISICSASIGISSGLILVKTHGSLGVAVGMALGIVIQQALMLGFARYKCGLWTHADMFFLYRQARSLLVHGRFL